jgi:hypothetical protein
VRLGRRAVTSLALLALAGPLIACVALLFLADTAIGDWYRGPLRAWVRAIPTAAYAAAVPTLNSVYLAVARRLNAWEVSRSTHAHNAIGPRQDVETARRVY